MLCSEAVREGFQSMGVPYAGSKFMNGYVISKPGRGRRLYWHQDWWGWDKRESYGQIPPMFAIMTYLTETRAPTATDPGNGCLRIIPGTHRKRHYLHNRVPDAHGDEISFSEMEGPAFDAEVEGAIDLPMRPGDAALVDVRVLHATRDNNTDERRSMITCWWVPQPGGAGAAAEFPYEVPEEWGCDPDRSYRLGLRVLGMRGLNSVDLAQLTHEEILRSRDCLSDAVRFFYGGPFPFGGGVTTFFVTSS